MSSDGLLRVPRPAVPLHFTGERITSEISGGVEAEHLHRYCMARDLVVGRDVLDVASGEGYGAALLSDVARSVIGVERDAEAVSHARRAYPGANLSFVTGDALALPLADASRDVVVSFETLEHLREHSRFLSEVRRVLRPGGLFVVSTPDRNVHSGYGMPVNPHHLLELSRTEFEGLLQTHFAHLAVFSQRTLAGSILLGGTGGEPRTYERRDESTIEATTGVARAVYLVAVACDGPLPPLPPSLYAGHPSLEGLFASVAYERGEVAKARQQADQRFHDVAAAEARAANLAAGLEAADALNADLSARLEAADALNADLSARFEAADARHADLSTRLGEAETSRQAADARGSILAAELAALRGSTGARLGLFAAHRLSRLPAPIRATLRAGVRGLFRAREHFRDDGPPALLPQPMLPLPVSPAPVLALPNPLPPANTASALLEARFSGLRPFPCFPVPASRPRVSVVTDSVGPSSLFGGVGTALVLGALLANRLDATLRLVTRMELPEAKPVQDVLDANGVVLAGPLEVVHAPLDGTREIALAPDDIFVTTSWWTTAATLGSVPLARVAAIVQEDERMFYPHGDDRLRCLETLSHPGLLTVVNTEMLYRHLTGGPQPLANLRSDGVWFEPAFPGTAEPKRQRARRRLFFYARPAHLRNLFWRGIEALDAAIADGLFPPDTWEIHCVGRDIPEVTLPRGVVPFRLPPMDWASYRAFVASMDAGFTLMDTPHPSYPPLDLAAAGSAVLTNTHPGKESLAQYSDNILLAPPTRDGLVEGLRRLQALGEDDEARAANRAADRIGRDWTAALTPVVDRLANRFAQA